MWEGPTPDCVGVQSQKCVNAHDGLGQHAEVMLIAGVQKVDRFAVAPQRSTNLVVAKTDSQSCMLKTRSMGTLL